MSCVECGSPEVVAKSLCRKHYMRIWSRKARGTAGRKTTGMTDLERFLSFVEKKDSGCWEWTASFKSKAPGKDYGSFYCNGKTIRAHRFSFLAHGGVIGPGQYVCHSCDNTKCVNPSHLFAGSPADNVKDRVSKGRSARLPGLKNARGKLSDKNIIEIIRLSSHLSVPELMDRFQVSKAYIYQVIRIASVISRQNHLVSTKHG